MIDRRSNGAVGKYGKYGTGGGGGRKRKSQVLEGAGRWIFLAGHTARGFHMDKGKR